MRWQDLVAINPWWRRGVDFELDDPDMMRLGEVPIRIKREKLALQLGRIYILRGIRRVGKTVYLKNLVYHLISEGEDPRSILYVSCDRLGGRRKALLNAIRNFLDNFTPAKSFIMLDEITYLKDEWVIVLKELAERPEAENMAIIATGSNPVSIREKSERLPGRRIEGNNYLMYPLTFRQYLANLSNYAGLSAPLREAATKISSLNEISIPPRSDDLRSITDASLYLNELQILFRKYLLSGGFPHTINEYLKNGRISLDRYEELIKVVLGDLSSVNRSEAIAKVLLSEVIDRQNYGQRTSYTSLGARTGYSHTTILSYLETLEEGFILFTLNAVDVSNRGWWIKPKSDKKIFVTDPFLYHALAAYLRGEEGFSLSEKTINDEELASKLVEGVVASHLLRTRITPYLVEKDTFLGFTYDKKGEIDIVFRAADNVVGFEVKYKEEIGKIKRNNVHGVRASVILTRNDYNLSQEPRLIPVSLFLALLPKSGKLL